jgi:hypothetical protein
MEPPTIAPDPAFGGEDLEKHPMAQDNPSPVTTDSSSAESPPPRGNGLLRWLRGAPRRLAERLLRPQLARLDGELARLDSELARLESELARREGGLRREAQDAEKRMRVAASEIRSSLTNELLSQTREIHGMRKRYDRGLASLTSDLGFQQRRLSRLNNGEIASKAASQAPVVRGELDDLYMRLQGNRGTQEQIRGRLRPAMERLRQMWPGHPGRPLLDLFSGRGEWLELMHEAGLRAYGIDSRRDAVEVCEAAGLDVRQANPVDHLRGLPDASLGAITMLQAIDRMSIEALFELLQQIRRTLIAEGVVLLEASNPANLAVATTEFYEDPTRLRPVPPDLARRLLEHAGFVEVELLWLGGLDQPQLRDGEPAEIGAVAEFLTAAPAYALIARRA